MNKINKYLSIWVVLFIAMNNLFGQTTDVKIPSEFTDGVQIETKSSLFNAAFHEISDMLDGKQTLSIKRAVFLVEWAYLDGKLDYEEYCNIINNAADFLKRFIRANKMERYKTAKNMALIEYFFRPYSGNGHKAFTYDFETFEEKFDFSHLFVTKVMQTNTGQCHSLPMYYRVLAEAIDAEAYIALAPEHTFIRYRDEDNLFPEDWVNVEIASHQLNPEILYREHFGVTDKTIESKLYLHPLTEIETVASILTDLTFGYWSKYKVYDDFTYLCANKSLEYFPQDINASFIKNKSIGWALEKYLKYNGYKKDAYGMSLANQINETLDRLEHFGWEEMSDETRNLLDKNVEEAKKATGSKNKQ